MLPFSEFDPPLSTVMHTLLESIFSGLSLNLNDWLISASASWLGHIEPDLDLTLRLLVKSSIFILISTAKNLSNKSMGLQLLQPGFNPWSLQPVSSRGGVPPPRCECELLTSSPWGEISAGCSVPNKQYLTLAMSPKLGRNHLREKSTVYKMSLCL